MNEILNRAIIETSKYIDMANKMYGLHMSVPLVTFNLRGQVAGYANVRKNNIRYNKDLLIANEASFLARTVPHEVAHIVAQERAGYFRRIKSHGIEWKKVMLDFGVKDITRCHSYDTTNARTVRGGYIYACGCQEYNFTIIRHRRMMQGCRSYQCRKCRGKLVLKNELTRQNIFDRVLVKQ